MEFEYKIPTIGGGTKTLRLNSGTSAVFVGANGAGKSRLGTHLELVSSYGAQTHRIGAQRALVIPETFQLTDSEAATNLLLYGHRTLRPPSKDHRWQRQPTTHLLNDFEALLVALFAETLQAWAEAKSKAGSVTSMPDTNLDKAISIWNENILTRRIINTGALSVENPSTGDIYPGNEMSDGERVLFYMIGQSLKAPPNGVIIIDEPELHIHKSILGKVWSRIEALRHDCLFIYFTHDIDFAASRPATQRFAVRSYDGKAWEIEDIPDGLGLPDDITLGILGSRKPILFIEGRRRSVDLRLYMMLYQDFTVIPAGSCEDVIHLTVSYNSQKDLHHLNCFGLIDKNGRVDDQIKTLARCNVCVIEFAEIENMLLDEAVLCEVGNLMGFGESEVLSRVEQAKKMIFALAAEEIEKICVDYVKRSLARYLKMIGFVEKNIDGLSSAFKGKIDSLCPREIYEQRKNQIEEAIAGGNYRRVLSICDHKGMVKRVGGCFDLKPGEYTEFVLRQIGRPQGQKLLRALQNVSPRLDAQGPVG